MWNGGIWNGGICRNVGVVVCACARAEIIVCGVKGSVLVSLCLCSSIDNTRVLSMVQEAFARQVVKLEALMRRRCR